MVLTSESEVKQSVKEVKTVFNTASTRIYFIDNLKILLAVLVILHHAAQPYGPGGGWWITSANISIIDMLF
jgi:peptidoglycan/LPS O-acetylase OafA/YrhL